MRRNGLSFENFTHFIFQVKTKKKALIYGPDYVVLSRDLYDELTRTPDPEIVFDDIIDEMASPGIKKELLYSGHCQHRIPIGQYCSECGR